jgi:hypothetical protein
MTKHNDYVQEHLYYSGSRIKEKVNEEGCLTLKGDAWTPYGIVAVWTLERTDYYPKGYTHLSWIYVGFYYSRSYDRFYRKPYLMEVIKKFVAAVISGEVRS